jgi:gamma-glutamylcyclotransferase (GGCT)/AIG2-like uncharacterized protein YtfP
MTLDSAAPHGHPGAPAPFWDRGPARTNVFVSYRRADSAGHAGRLYDRLVTRLGAQRVFMDVTGIAPGSDFVDRIDEELQRCGALVLVIGPRWEGAQEDGSRRIDDPEDFVRLEVTTGLQLRVPVIPVLVQGASMPPADRLPPEMQPIVRRNALVLDDGRWEHDLQRLVEAVESTTAGAVGHRTNPLHRVPLTVGVTAHLLLRPPPPSSEPLRIASEDGQVALTVPGAWVDIEESYYLRDGPAVGDLSVGRTVIAAEEIDSFYERSTPPWESRRWQGIFLAFGGVPLIESIERETGAADREDVLAALAEEWTPSSVGMGCVLATPTALPETLGRYLIVRIDAVCGSGAAHRLVMVAVDEERTGAASGGTEPVLAFALEILARDRNTADEIVQSIEVEGRLLTASTGEPTQVFVYGTTQPGHVRYEFIEDFVAHTRPARVVGQLFDTGAGYPAAKFGEGRSLIEGHLLELHPDLVDEAFRTFAEIEADLYAPVEVETVEGESATAYEWIGSTDGFELLDGVWTGE